MLVLCTVALCLFFFFKQKTAYERRISDWSSDVCSSDLPVLRRGRPVPPGAPASVMAIGIFALADLQHLPRISEALRVPLTLFLLSLWGHMAASFLAAAAAGRLRDQIGRA